MELNLLGLYSVILTLIEILTGKSVSENKELKSFQSD